ncbi:MAG TPA: pitrilysin family protein [Acidobacteriota bacterium]|jgi:zinc protease
MKSPAIPVLRQALPNGVVLLISPNAKIPMVHVNVVVRCGTADNSPHRSGLASLMARMLDEGTSRYTHQQIAEIIENLGGSLGTFSSRELSGVSVMVLSKDVLQGIELAHAVATDPSFPEERLKVERDKVLNQIRSTADNPQIVASNEFNRIVYQRHPVGEPILGELETISEVTASELRDFHTQMFAPDYTIVAVVGDVHVETCNEWLAEKFSAWRNPHRRQASYPALEKLACKVSREIPLPKEQINIYLGHLGITRSDPDYYALQVMDVVLGGGPGFTSRIPAKLRDQQGLAYSTYSDISGTAGIFPGRFAAFISTSPQNRDLAIEGLLREIKTLIDEGITDQELSDAQSYLTGSFVFDFQSNGHVARFLLSAEIFGLGFDYLDRYPAIIGEISKGDVNRVARDHLDAENYAVVVAGPV